MSHELTADNAVLSAPRRLFTVESANRSLVLVRRIVAGIVAQYQELAALRARVASAQRAKITSDAADALRREADMLVAALSRLQEELADVGCELKDFATGLVDFPASHEGRTVYLCWKFGEERVEHWHELDAGFSGRRPIGVEFTAAQ